MSFGPNVGCSGVMTGSVFLWYIPRYCNTVSDVCKMQCHKNEHLLKMVL